MNHRSPLDAVLPFRRPQWRPMASETQGISPYFTKQKKGTTWHHTLRKVICLDIIRFQISHDISRYLGYLSTYLMRAIYTTKKRKGIYMHLHSSTPSKCTLYTLFTLLNTIKTKCLHAQSVAPQIHEAFLRVQHGSFEHLCIVSFRTLREIGKSYPAQPQSNTWNLPEKLTRKLWPF